MDQDCEHPINNAHQILRDLLRDDGIRVLRDGDIRLRLWHGLARHVLDEKTKKHLKVYQDEIRATITRCLLYHTGYHNISLSQILGDVLP